ncbi:MAG TPA: AgmX/PglI C-terminal domain-containing protein [Enhygromyxa sp.]|nr:AgmX/PglI C-terminal domain-containing protein [Enhygromyxa sp.]
MIRSRSASLTLVSFALALGCSSKSSAPSSAEVQPELRSEAAPVGVSEEAAPADATASQPAPEPEASEREDGAPPSGAARKAKEASRDRDDALGGSRLRIAEPMVGGGIDRDIIRRKAQDHEADIRACHARGLEANPELAGTVAVKLEVDARGVVKDVDLGSAGDLTDREVVDCILELVSKWSFAGEATGKATVELKLELSPN